MKKFCQREGYARVLVWPVGTIICALIINNHTDEQKDIPSNLHLHIDYLETCMQFKSFPQNILNFIQKDYLTTQWNA